MSTTHGISRATLRKANSTLRVFIDLGIELEHMERVESDPFFAARLVQFWKAGAVTHDSIFDNESQAKARSIMGKNFLGLDEVHRGFGLTLDPDQFATIPFREETLQEHKDTHILVAYTPLSLEEIFTLSHEICYRYRSYVEEESNLGWHLIGKEPAQESIDKTESEQFAMLTNKAGLPRLSELAYMVNLYWLTYGERLLKDCDVLCQDVDYRYNHMVFGFSDRCQCSAHPYVLRQCYRLYSKSTVTRSCVGIATSVFPQKP